MGLREIFHITKGTKIVLMVSLSVSVMAILFAGYYYGNINRAEDPRTLSARKLLLLYDQESGSLNDFNNLRLLDSAAAIYNSFQDYKGSFETGIILNNKASTLLLTAIYDSTLTLSGKEVMLCEALKYCDSSISCYRQWIHEWGNLEESEIRQKQALLMKEDDQAFVGINFRKVFDKRIKDLLLAQIETYRRISVSLTNKGTILRHLNSPDSALYCYREALEIWKDNRIARSNMNVLMGGEPVKASFIEALFPPDRKKRQ